MTSAAQYPAEPNGGASKPDPGVPVGDIEAAAFERGREAGLQEARELVAQFVPTDKPDPDGGPVYCEWLGRSKEEQEGRRQEVRINPGPDPNRVRMEWLLHGEAGTVQFVVWVTTTNDPRFNLPRWEFYPVDVGYHAHKPTYEGHDRMDACEFMPDGKGCFYDGSSLAADDLWKKVMDGGGHEAIWSTLNEWYEDRLLSEARNGD